MNLRAGAIGFFLNATMNVVIPVLWFTVVANHVHMEPVAEFAVGMITPLCYGFYVLFVKKKISVLSVLSVASILVSIAFNYLEVNRFWFAVKTMWLPVTVMSGLLLRRALFIEKGLAVVREAGGDEAVPKAERIIGIFARYLPFHFGMNAVLNFLSTWFLVTAEPGTTEFNVQYGELIWKSLFFVGGPCGTSMGGILWWTFHRLKVDVGVSPKLLAKAAARSVALHHA